MKKSLFKNIIKYVSLSVLGMIGISCYILADTFFVSKRFGINGLVSLNLAISIYSFINATGLMIGIGGATQYAFSKSRNETGAKNIFFNTSVAGILAALVFVFVGVFYSYDLCYFLGANESIIGMTNTYLKTILCFAPFFIFNNILIAFVRNDKEPKLSMIAMIIGSFSNIILDYIFIFILNMGMFGAAFATGIAPIISICILGTHFKRSDNSIVMMPCKIKIKNFFKICSLGLSSFITELSSGITLIVFNLIIIMKIGNVGVAAYGIVANLSLIAVSIFVGIAQGIQPIVSKQYAKNDIYELKMSIKYTVILSLSMAVLIYILVFTFTNQLVCIFNSEGNELLSNYAKTGIQVYFIGFIFAGLNITFSALLSAINKPKKGLTISVLRAFVFAIPFVLLFSSFWGIVGVWVSFIATELVTLMISTILILKVKL